MLELNVPPGGGVTLDEFSRWLMTLQPELRYHARRLSGNPTNASDLLQATNLRALEKRHLFVSGALRELMKWLFRIMSNLHRDGVRSRKRELFVDWLDEVPKHPEAAPPRWAMFGDEEVLAAIGRLSPRLRNVYELYAVHRCSYATISSRLGIPIGTVGTQIFRARDRLRTELDGLGPALRQPDRA